MCDAFSVKPLSIWMLLGARVYRHEFERERIEINFW